MDNNLLNSGFLHLESRSRRNLLNSKFAGVQTLPLFMQANFSIGIGRDFSKVKGFRRVRSFPGAGVGHVEARTLHGGAGDTIHLIDCQFRGFVVLEHHLLRVTSVECDGLLTICILIGQIVRSRDRQFCDFIGARLHTQGDSAILASSHIVLIVAVNRFNPEHGARDRCSGISGVNLGDCQFRLLEVIKDELLIIARPQPNGLGRLRSHHIGVRYRDFCDLVAVNGDPR